MKEKPNMSFNSRTPLTMGRLDTTQNHIGETTQNDSGIAFSETQCNTSYTTSSSLNLSRRNNISSEVLASFYEPESCDLLPKTDYTYSRTSIYKENPTLLEHISPNMSRTPIRSYQIWSTSEEQHIQSQNLINAQRTSYSINRNTNNNASNRMIESETILSTITPRQRRNSGQSDSQRSTSSRRSRRISGQSSISGTEDGDAMILRSGSRISSTHGLDQVLESREENDMYNTALRNSKQYKQPYTKPNGFINYDNSSNNSYHTTRKTIHEEYNINHSPKSLYTSTPNNYHRQSLIHPKTQTSVQHAYGLDYEGSLSDVEDDGVSSFGSSEEESVSNTIITTITTTVTTTIEKITSIIHPVAGPVYHNVCKPVCWALTYPCYWLWTALVWTLSSIYSTYTGQDANTSATTTTTKSYRKQQYTSKYSNKERSRWGGIGCCLCLPCLLALLLLSLLSFLPAWLGFLAGSNSTSEQIIPLVIPAVVNQTNINLRQEILMLLKQENNLTRAEIVDIARSILQDELQVIKLNMNSKSQFYANKAASRCRKGCSSNMQNFEGKLEAMAGKNDQILKEMGSIREAIRLEYGNHEDRLASLEAELANLQASVIKLDEQYFLLAENLNRGQDFSQISSSVHQIITQMMVDYGDGSESDSGFMVWIRDNFISRDHFDAQMRSFGEELSLKLATIAREEQQRAASEQQQHYQHTVLHHDSVNEGHLNVSFIKEMIDVALWKFAADKTGLVDYALESGGGHVITVRCSEPYNKLSTVVSVWGIPLYYPTNSPRVAISPEMSPGDCWPFKGNKGYLAVKLSRTVVPSSFSIEHIPKAIAPGNNIDSAPSDFTVLCLSGEEDRLGVSLGNYTFQEDGSSLQYFPVQIRDPAPCRFVELRILDNHGNKEYTCLYRFRVHGTPAELKE